MKEKKNQQFAIRLECETAKSIRKLSERLNLSMGEIVRLCVNRQLGDSGNLAALARKRKTLQFSVRFEDSLSKNLSKFSRQSGLSAGEIIRLCVNQQLEQIWREGGIKLKLSPEDK